MEPIYIFKHIGHLWAMMFLYPPGDEDGMKFSFGFGWGGENNG